MKTVKTIIYSSLCAVCALNITACDYSEDALEASNELTSYQLPQGNHDYDATIQRYYDKYGFYLLYKFTEKDAYWTPTGWQDGAPTTEEDSGKSGYICSPTNENFVGAQLQLLDELWLSKLEDNALKNLLPRKILLCSDVATMLQKYVFVPTFQMVFQPYSIPAQYNFDNIAVSGGSEETLPTSDADKKSFLHEVLLQWAAYLAERKTTLPSEYIKSLEYTSTVTRASKPIDCCAVGILNAGYESSKEKDWLKFVEMMLCYSENYLTESPGDIASWSGWTSYSSALGASVYNYDKNFHGILNATKDVNGILKKRYDIVRKYYLETYKTDLQEVGNKLGL